MNNQWLVRAFSKTLTLKTLTHSFPRPFCSSTFAIKNVTKNNFDSALEDLKKHVRDADFVSIDLEMTGVTSAPWRESLDFDRFDVRYLKVKDSVEKFAVVQFGVCPFRWDASKESFIAHPHNFYIFPRKELPFDGPAHEFLCQTTSIDFLAKYLFDFNTCIHEGISYLSREQEAEALGRLNSAFEDDLSNSAHQLKEPKDSSSSSSADILFTWRMKNRFSEWRDSLLRNSNGGYQIEENSKNLTPQFQTVFFKMRPALKLSGFTSHQLRLIRLVATKHFKDLAFVRANGENASEQKLVVYTDSEDDRIMLMKEVRDDMLKEAELKVKDAAGFRHVIDLLSSEQKLVVGHNSFLDIAHVYSKFFGPLPSTVDEFVSRVHRNFGHIIDTKLLLNVDPVIQYLMKKKSTSLSSAFSLLCPQIAFASESSTLVSGPGLKVEVQVDEMRSSNWNSGAKHEAGYDAFMTGCVFAQACRHLGIQFNSVSSTGLAYHEKLQKYINLLYISWNNDAIIDLHTGDKTFGSSTNSNYKRQYPKILFQNIVLIWGFPLKFKPRDIKDCLTKVFGPDSVTSIFHLDETASFIQFSKKEFVSNFLELKETLDGKSDPISVLHPFSKLLEGGKTGAATYEVYKEICSSSLSKKLFADQAEAVGKCKKKVVEMREECEPQGTKNGEVPSSSSTEVVAENSNADSVNKNEIEKISCDLYPTNRHLSGVELMNALYVTESHA